MTARRCRGCGHRLTRPSEDGLGPVCRRRLAAPAARQAAGIDGTAGDAQDVPHDFVADTETGGCLLCGLAPGYRKHTAARPDDTTGA